MQNPYNIKFKVIIRFILLALLFNSNIQYGQQLNPSIKNYSINDYNADNQNWGIDINEKGEVFVANNKGLLKYNGQKWSLFNLPNNAIIRSVLCLGDKVYTGSYEEFGFWEKDEQDNYIYKSLTTLFLNNFKFTDDEIWQILSFDNKIIFRSFGRLYIYDGKSIGIIENSENVLNLAFYKNQLLVNSLPRGLLVLKGNGFSPHSVSKDYTSIKNMAVLGDSLFIYDEKKGAVVISDNGKVLLSKELNILLKKFVLNKVSFINNNQILLGTVKNGIIIYEISNNRIKIIDKISGLQNNTILGQKIKNNKIWLSLDNGIARINLKNFNEFYKDFSGKLGAVYDIEFLKNDIYLASNTGLYSFTNSNMDLIENSEGHIWNLLRHKSQLLCAHNSGIKIYNNKKLIYSHSEMGGVYFFKKIPNKKDSFLLGTYVGLSILELTKDSGWKVTRVKNVSFPVNKIVFESDNIIWITHPYKGVFRANININESRILEINSFTENSKLSDYKTKIYKRNDKILLHNRNQYFTYSQKDSTLIDFELFNSFQNNNFINEDKFGNWFINENKEVTHLDKDLKTDYILNSTEIKKRLVTGFEKIKTFNDSIKILNLNDGFVKFNINELNTISKKEIKPIINKIYTKQRELKINNFHTEVTFKEAKLITLDVFSPYEYESIIKFNLEGKIKYEGKSNKGKIELQNLNYGNYILNLKSINSSYKSKTIKLSIKVLRPWYLSYWMYTFYLLILLLAFYTVKVFSERKFKREQAKIQEELILNTKKKINIIEKQNLKNEIKSKKKVLATITESIIKKNEIIIILKNELNRVSKTYPEQYISKKLLKVANESISNNRDWKVFEESFNDLHEDFLKKIVYKFPKLTSKDLKLCAYIKTGHTSKEIAPLLGITVRGIEIQRYRLRKKMGLSKEQSIFDFLIYFE